MIRHIVVFSLAATDPQEREANAAEMRIRLEALAEVVPGLLSMTVRPDLGLLDGHFDVVLISDHVDRDALETYQSHPAHREVAGFVNSVISGKATVDFEI